MRASVHPKAAKVGKKGDKGRIPSRMRHQHVIHDRQSLGDRKSSFRHSPDTILDTFPLPMHNHQFLLRLSIFHRREIETGSIGELRQAKRGGCFSSHRGDE